MRHSLLAHLCAVGRRCVEMRGRVGPAARAGDGAHFRSLNPPPAAAAANPPPPLDAKKAQQKRGKTFDGLCVLSGSFCISVRSILCVTSTLALDHRLASHEALFSPPRLAVQPPCLQGQSRFPPLLVDTSGIHHDSDDDEKACS